MVKKEGAERKKKEKKGKRKREGSKKKGKREEVCLFVFLKTLLFLGFEAMQEQLCLRVVLALSLCMRVKWRGVLTQVLNGSRWLVEMKEDAVVCFGPQLMFCVVGHRHGTRRRKEKSQQTTSPKTTSNQEINSVAFE